jgi:CheY-like chemotaxis protein
VPVLANPLVDAGAGSLAEAIASEARRAFSDLASNSLPTAALAGDPAHEALAALWSAFARIRSLVETASDGRAELPLTGPYGMIPLAPTLADGPGVAGAPPGAAGEALAGRRLVVADTDPILLGALSRTLQRLGASVLPARDAEQALDLAERHWPDAVIADVHLPTLGGLELCRRLREDLALADLPVALICWREDLLAYASRSSDQRGGEPRPLSAGAFAPLGEALVRRLALERRLERDGSAHGRLRGLSPRLLMELCARSAAGSLLRLRSGRLTAEVAFLAGRPIHARLLDNGAPAAEAAAALAPLLGMRSGRFGIEPLASAYAAHFSGDLVTVLAAPIARARRARALLSSAGLDGLGRVDLDPRVTAQYVEEAPAAQRAALARLLRGETFSAVRAADASDVSGGSPLLGALLELSRRGGLVALLDPAGADLLAPDAERSATRGARSRRESPPMPAALTLAEAVLQAVSANDADKPSGRRTQRGLAPPAPGVAGPRASSDAAAETAAVDTTGEAAAEPRDVPEAWSSEPAVLDELTGAHPRPSDEPLDDMPPPTTLGARLRSIVSPVLVTLVAAALAFAGMRVVLGGGLDGLGIAPSALLGVGAPRDGGTRDSVATTPAPPASTPAGPEETPPSAPPVPTAAGGEPTVGEAMPTAALAPPDAGTPAPSASAPGAPAPDAPAPAAPDSAGVSFTAEQLELPAGPPLPPGNGVLELQTWEPQRLYVDGVFVGNYTTRLIPLTPGTYRVRFGTATRELEHPATIVAGRRTRLTARPEKAP